MIIDSAARLEGLAAEVIILRRSQQHGESLAHRRTLVDALLERARAARASGAALSERLGEAEPSSPLFDSALRSISAWRSPLEDDLAQALSGDLFANFQSATTKAAAELERRASELWRRYSAQRSPDISAELLAALESDPRAGSTVARIRRLADTLRSLRDRPTPTPAELTEFDAVAAQLRSAWSTLDVESLSEEIVAFLRAANGENGAPLDLLTSQVRDWLGQRGAIGHYVVRPADQ